MSIGAYGGAGLTGGGSQGGGGGGNSGGGGGGGNRNRLVVQGVRNQMEQFKTEVAGQLGLISYDQMDKGELTSRQNGYVGGNMTKKMVEYAENQIGQNGGAVIAQSTQSVQLPLRIRQMNEAASQGQAPGQLMAPRSMQNEQLVGQPIVQFGQQTGMGQGMGGGATQFPMAAQGTQGLQ